MGVTGLPSGVPEGDVTGAGDQIGEVGQKKLRGGTEPMEAKGSEEEFFRKASNPKELRELDRSPVEPGTVIFRPGLRHLKLELNIGYWRKYSCELERKASEKL